MFLIYKFKDIETLQYGFTGPFVKTGERTKTLISHKSITKFATSQQTLFIANPSPSVTYREGMSTEIGARWKIELIYFEEN